MGIFSRKKKEDTIDDLGHVRKQSTYDVHDPILTAIRDEEPFQMSANSHPVGTVSPEMNLRDVFGNPIDRPDRSNPTRPRNERPLDTIRAFEYACTGDERLRDEMETPRLGWTTRQNFSAMPKFESNPYAMASAPAPANVIAFGNNGDAEGTPLGNTLAAPVKQEKKKRRFFGRRKK